LNERLVTAAGAIAALLIVVGLFSYETGRETTTFPTSLETGPNGYGALRLWLESAGVPTVSLRAPLTNLPASTGHILLTTGPFEKPFSGAETTELLSWVAQGNTLIIAAALNDTPDWSLERRGSGSLIDDLAMLSGTRFEAALDEGGEAVEQGDLISETELKLEPGAHRLAGGAREFIMVSDNLTSVWMPDEDSLTPGSPFLFEPVTGLPAAWVEGQGSGHVILMASASLLTNRAIGLADNRTLLGNLVRHQMSAGGRFLFDDFHQGISELYDPEAFYSDPRVGVSVLFILLFWFVYMVGTQSRLMPVREETPLPRQEDLVAASGGFMARKLTKADTALMMFDAFSAELEERGLIGEGDDPWQYLSTSPLVGRRDIEALRGLHAEADRGAKVDLKKIHNHMESMREALG
jgi:hypothetical protein